MTKNAMTPEQEHDFYAQAKNQAPQGPPVRRRRAPLSDPIPVRLPAETLDAVREPPPPMIARCRPGSAGPWNTSCAAKPADPPGERRPLTTRRRSSSPAPTSESQGRPRGGRALTGRHSRRHEAQVRRLAAQFVRARIWRADRLLRRLIRVVSVPTQATKAQVRGSRFAVGGRDSPLRARRSGTQRARRPRARRQDS